MSNPINLLGRHFLTLKDFSPPEIHYLLDLAKKLKAKKQAGIRDQLLQGKNIALLFDKSSTRTRCAFEVAAFDEGAHVTFLMNSQMGVKESLEDTAKVLGRYYDAIEFRGYAQAEIDTLAQHAGVPVWNGLTDEDHPTQALADLMTISEHTNKPWSAIKLVYVGDARNNVAHSLLTAATQMGMHFVALSPPPLQPNADLLRQMQALAKQTHAQLEVSEQIEIAVKGADFIYTDVWVSMGEDDQYAERIALLEPYRVTQQLLNATQNPQVKFMHCLPSFHDRNTIIGEQIYQRYGISEMEVSDEVFRSRHAIVFDQAENRIHTIKAIMVAALVAS